MAVPAGWAREGLEVGPVDRLLDAQGGWRTVAQLLSAEQVERYRSWIDNDRRLRQLVKQLEALAIETAQTAEGWAPDPPPRGPDRTGR